MQTLTAKTKFSGWCPICLNQTSQLFLKNEPATRDSDRPAEFQSMRVDIVRCESCRAVFVQRNFSEELLDSFYSERAGGKFPADMENFRWWLQSTKASTLQLLRLIKNEPRGPLLDIGCGRGALLNLAKQQRWPVSGLELNGELADFVRNELDIQVTHGNLFHTDIPKNHYSVITLFDVLEHLYHPVQALSRCLEALRPGGMVVVKSPFWRSQHRKERIKKALGMGTGDIANIGHINQFDPRSIRTAFQKAGLNCVKVIPARSFLPAIRGASFSLRRTLDWGARALTNGLTNLAFKTTRLNLSFNLLGIARKPV